MLGCGESSATATRAPTLLGHPVDFSFLHFSLTTLPRFFYPYYACSLRPKVGKPRA